MGCETSAELQIRADDGDRNAQYDLALKYTRNINGTIRYLKLAATQGHSESAYILCDMYKDGNLSSYKFPRHANETVKIDYDEAYKWFIKSKYENYTFRRYSKFKTKIISNREQVASDIKDGTKESLYKLGIAYIVGQRGIDYTYVYRKKNTEIHYNDSYCLFTYGIIGIDEDHKKGIAALSKSATQGNREASNQLGYIYGYQKINNEYSDIRVDVDLDLEVSYKHFKKAGNTTEMLNVANLLKVDTQLSELQTLKQDIDLLKRNQVAPPSYDKANE